MTNEEAIKEIQSLEYYGRPFDNSIEQTNKADRKRQALEMGIKALEQEPILDKIRAEIAEYKDDKIIHAERNEMIDIVLDIIDKYKAESEGKHIAERGTE